MVWGVGFGVVGFGVSDLRFWVGDLGVVRKIAKEVNYTEIWSYYVGYQFAFQKPAR